MSIVIELPDALAERLRAAAEAEGTDLNNYAVAKLELSLAPEYEEEDEELIAALNGVIDDYNSGDRGTPVEEFMAELDEKYGRVPMAGIRGLYAPSVR